MPDSSAVWSSRCRLGRKARSATRSVVRTSTSGRVDGRWRRIGASRGGGDGFGWCRDGMVVGAAPAVGVRDRSGVGSLLPVAVSTVGSGRDPDRGWSDAAVSRGAVVSRGTSTGAGPCVGLRGASGGTSCESSAVRCSGRRLTPRARHRLRAVRWAGATPTRGPAVRAVPRRKLLVGRRHCCVTGFVPMIGDGVGHGRPVSVGPGCGVPGWFCTAPSRSSTAGLARDAGLVGAVSIASGPGGAQGSGDVSGTGCCGTGCCGAGVEGMGWHCGIEWAA